MKLEVHFNGLKLVALRSALLLGVCLALCLDCQAQARPQIVAAVDAAQRVTLAGTVHPAIFGAGDLGEVAPELPMQRMMLILRPSSDQSAALSQLLDDQQNPSSPNFHRWLTPLQFGAQFGPATADVQAVRGWLEAQGFEVTKVAQGGWWMQFSGTAAQVSRAFGTHIHRYSVNGVLHTANATNISIPAALAPVVHGVLSLNDFAKRPAHSRVRQLRRSSSGKLVAASSPTALPDATFSSGATHYLTPGDMAAIYDTNPLLKQGTNGSGVSIAVIGQTDVELADIESFRSIFNLPANDPLIVVDGTDPGFSNGDEEESDLDLEYAGALAPQAQIIFVTSASTIATSGVDLSSAYAVDNAVAPIVSLSYGECEAELGAVGNFFENALWQQAAAEGITVFVSSGDSGSANCDAGGQLYDAAFGLQVSGLASTPYNIAVGGTTLAEGANASTYWSTANGAGYASALGYIPETAWNDSCDVTLDPNKCAAVGGRTILSAGGGGRSGCLSSTFGISGFTCTGSYAQPPWQSGTGVPADNRRWLPDLSLAASGDHDGYLICNEGSCQTGYQNGVITLEAASVIGGTSASTPSMAGIMALVEQKNGAFQGQANYTFYKLAANQNTAACNSVNLITPSQTGACIFHDVTTGSNAVPCYGSSPDCSSTLNGVTGLLTGYAATAGFDGATGLGSVDASNLVAAWQSVAPAASSTKLALGSSSVVHGQPVSFTASVQPATGAGTPSGNVALQAGTQQLGPYTLSGGAVAASTAMLPGGSYSVSARYAGDASYAASTSNLVPITITPEAGKVALKLYYYDSLTNSSQPVSGSIELGAPLYYLAQAQGASGQGVATGTVNFTLDGTSLGSYPLNSAGQAAVDSSLLSLPTVLPGAHTVVASYSGDASFQAAVSAAAPLTISQGLPTTFAIPNVTSITQGQPVQVAISLGLGYSVAPLPTGTVQLYDNGVALGQPLTLAGNGPQGMVAQAIYNANSLAVGTHKLAATYSGDTYYAPVALGGNYAFASTIVVSAATKSNSTVTLASSASSVAIGQSVQYTVKVNPATANAPVPTGTVTLSDPTPYGLFGFTVAPAAPLTNGALTTTQTYYGSGNLQVYASYSGDSNYAPSVSPVIMTTYSTIAPTAQLSVNAAYTLPGSQSSITVQVAGRPNLPAYPLPTGPVQYYDALNGAPAKLIATQYLSPGNGNVSVDTLPVILPTGTNVITAQYGGDISWSAASTAAATIVVTPPDFTLSAPVGATPVTLGSTATATISAASVLNYAGNISFSCAGAVPPGTSCSFAPATVPASAAGASTVMTLATTAPGVDAAALEHGSDPPQPSRPWTAGAVLAGLLLMGISARKSSLRALSIVVLASLASLVGCTSSLKTSETVSLTSDFGTKAAAGTNVSFTATLLKADPNQQGTIIFADGASAIGNVTLKGNKATLQISSLGVGTHSIKAIYNTSVGGAPALSSGVLTQSITGTALVPVTATSGSLSHTINVAWQLQ